MFPNETLVVVANSRGWDNEELFLGLPERLHGIKVLSPYVMVTNSPKKYKGRKNFFTPSPSHLSDIHSHKMVVIQTILDDGDIAAITDEEIMQALIEGKTPLVILSHLSAEHMTDRFSGKTIVVQAGLRDGVDSIAAKVMECLEVQQRAIA